MKRILIALLLVCNGAVCMAQNADVKNFLDSFNTFCTTIEAVQDPTEPQIDSWKKVYKDIKHEYSTMYKKKMTDDEVQIYYSYVGRYNKKLSKKYLKEAGEFADTTAAKATKVLKRGASKVSGALRGFFRKDKQE